jgi:hypothetical protein
VQVKQIVVRRCQLRDACLVIQHQAQGYAAPPWGNFRQVLRERIIQAEPPLLREQHHGNRRELFADRADLEARLRPNGHGVFERGNPEALQIDGAAMPNYPERDPRDPLLAHLGANVALGRGGGIRRERRDLQQEPDSHEAGETSWPRWIGSLSHA